MNFARSQVILTVIGCLVFLAACGGRAYLAGPFDLGDLRQRAESQTDGPLQVSASVPSRDETEVLFGIDLYDQGIQPVWIEVQNSSEAQARYAPVSTDRYYFSPLEVAYMNRSGLSDAGRSDMERRFKELAMPRYIDAGESRSGFVFTHANFRAKGFNVDLFGPGDYYSFTFLLRVPGFVPDYANFDAASLYSVDEVATYDNEQIRQALDDMPCCTADERGDSAGEPINLMLIGNGRDLLRTLLATGWSETSATEAAEQAPQFLYGRQQDAIFSSVSPGSDGVYEMRVWLAPIKSGNEPVWLAQIRHFYRRGGSLRRLDADVDNARDFAIQKFLYGQSLQALGWLSGDEVVPVESFWNRLVNTPYFTDGYRAVLWLSVEPFSAINMDVKDWDLPPGWK